MKILFVGKFNPYSWGEYPTEYFISEAFRKNGIVVVQVDIDKFSNYEVTKRIVQWSKDCDLVLFTSGILQLALSDFEWICNQIIIPKILYTNDWIFLDKEREKIYLERFPFVDLLITSDSFDYSKDGIKQIRIPMACLPSYEFNPMPQKDLVFIGAVHYSKERREFLDKISKCFGNLDIYGHCGNNTSVYTKELEVVLQRHRITLGHNCVNSKGYWSSRNYIVPGYGGFLLTPYVAGLEEEFENKKHIVWYKDFEECVDLIAYYLKYADEREEIRQQGYEYTQKVHNWDNRAKEFARIFREIKGE